MEILLIICAALCALALLTARPKKHRRDEIGVLLPGKYLESMVLAAVSGDVEAGEFFEDARNHYIFKNETDDAPVHFSELYAVAQTVEALTDAPWAGAEIRADVATVILNRADALGYPDDVAEIAREMLPVKRAGIIPTETSVRAALDALLGLRTLDEDVTQVMPMPYGEVARSYMYNSKNPIYFCKEVIA